MTKRQLSSFSEAEAALAPYIPIVKEMTGKDITLDRMQPLMARIGNPQTKLKVIHVAGTSGKTSTAYYIASLLQQAGQTVGLTVSPHIDVLSERLQVNLEPLPEPLFCVVLTEFLDLIQGVEPRPSYFELLMAMAYWYFEKIGVDYAVIETGFGGLHDASNICQNADKVCVLTDIGFDHMHVLGNTLTQISAQKAGIMHEGNVAFTFEQPTEVMQVFKTYARRVGADLHDVDSVTSHNLQKSTIFMELPEFQKRNWQLAHAVIKYVAERDSLPQLSAEQLEQSMQTYVPGRMDKQQIGTTCLIMDGAHNEQKMAAFVKSFQVAFPSQKVPVLLGMKAGKEYLKVLELLKPITSQLIVTTYTIQQDVRSRPIDPHTIAKQARLIGFESIVIEPNTEAALRLILDDSPKIAIVTGSFYLLANIRGLMLKA